MSPSTCQRWIILGLAGTIALGGGCTATRPGSMPKWDLAWWKKDATDPKTRHDALAPPSATISPSASIAAMDPPNAVNTPARKPYAVDGKAQTKAGPPNPLSFELSKQNQAAAKGAARPPAGSANSQPIGSTVAESKSSAIPDSFESRFSNQSSATTSEQAAIGDQPIARVSQTNQPARYANPYVSQGESPSEVPAAKNDSSPNDSAGVATDGSVYTRTPYNAFAPKASTSPSPLASPLRPMSPPTAPAPATRGLPNIRPVGATPGEVAATPTNSSTTSPPSNGNTTTPPWQNSALPDILSQSQGSYAPGSIRTAQPASGAAPGQAQPLPAVLPIQAAPPSATAPLPSSPAPASNSGLGGGGSFMLSK